MICETLFNFFLMYISKICCNFAQVILTLMIVSSKHIVLDFLSSMEQGNGVKSQFILHQPSNKHAYCYRVLSTTKSTGSHCSDFSEVLSRW